MPQSKTKRIPKKKKKNESLDLLRAITKSMANAVPFTGQETRDTLDDTLSRVGSGLASQYMGEDPNTGEMVSPVVHNMKRIWNADARRKAGLPPEKRVMPGIVADTLSVPSMFGYNPPIVQDAADRASRIHAGVNEDMGLDAPEGFRQSAADSLGTMLGQLPVPGKKKVEAAEQLGGGALNMLRRYGKKALTSPVEFFSPTIDPSVANYGSGALFGGAMGAAADNPEPIMRTINALIPREIPKDPRLPNWTPPGYEEELPDINYDDLPAISMNAKGGKIRSIEELRKLVREGKWLHGTSGDPRKRRKNFKPSAPIFPHSTHLTQDPEIADFFSKVNRDATDLSSFGLSVDETAAKRKPKNPKILVSDPQIENPYDVTARKLELPEAQRIIRSTYPDNPDLAEAVSKRVTSRPLTGENVMKHLIADPKWQPSIPEAERTLREMNRVWRAMQSETNPKARKALRAQWESLYEHAKTFPSFGMGMISELPKRSIRFSLNDTDWERIQGGLSKSGFDSALYRDPIPEPTLWDLTTEMSRPTKTGKSLAVFDYDDVNFLPDEKAKGGKIGALTQMLKAININPDSTTVKKVPYQIGEPVEEVLYAVNEGQRKGVLSSVEAKQIKAMLDAGDDESLSEALLDLHARLQPKVTPNPLPPPRQLPPAQLGQGKMTPEEFELMLKRGQ